GSRDTLSAVGSRIRALNPGLEDGLLGRGFQPWKDLGYSLLIQVPLGAVAATAVTNQAQDPLYAALTKLFPPPPGTDTGPQQQQPRSPLWGGILSVLSRAQGAARDALGNLHLDNLGLDNLHLDNLGLDNLHLDNPGLDTGLEKAGADKPGIDTGGVD